MKKFLILLAVAMMAFVVSCEKDAAKIHTLQVELNTEAAVAEIQMVLVCPDQSIFYFDAPTVGNNTLILTDAALNAAAKPGAYLSVILFGKEKGELTLIKDHFYDLNPLTGDDKVTINL